MKRIFLAIALLLVASTAFGQGFNNGGYKAPKLSSGSGSVEAPAPPPEVPGAPTIASSTALTTITASITFSEAMDPTTANNELNYAISPPVTITSATLGGAGSNVVVFTFQAVLAYDTLYTFLVNNVLSAQAVEIAPNSVTQFTSLPDPAPSGPTIVSIDQTEGDEVEVTFSEEVDETTAETIGNYGLNPVHATVTSATKAPTTGGTGSITVNAVESTLNGGFISTLDLDIATTVDDDMIVVVISLLQNWASVSTVTDDNGNTYFSAIDNSPIQYGTAVWYAYNTDANAANTITVTLSGGMGFAFHAMTLTGAKASSPIGGTPVETIGTSATSFATSGFSTTTEGALVVCGATWGSSPTVVSWGAGQTARGESNMAGPNYTFGSAFSTEVVGSTPGSNEQELTISASQPCGLVAVEILAEPSGGAPGDPEVVALGLSNNLNIGQLYTLNVINVENLAGDPIAPDSSDDFTATLGDTPSGQAMLLHSTFASADAIHNPAVSQTTYGTQAEAVPDLANLSFVAGSHNSAAQVGGSISESTGAIRFDADNFDLVDIGQDGGRIDLTMRFDTDPKTHDTNTWIFYDAFTGTGNRDINFELTGSSPVYPMLDIYGTIEQSDERTPYGLFRPASVAIYGANMTPWNAVDSGEWHDYTLLWRNNGAGFSDEAHMFIDGTLVHSSYNGSLPGAADITDLHFAARSASQDLDFTFDELYSFDSWDVSGDTGDFATITWPEQVYQKHPLADGTWGDTGLQITSSNQITYEWMVQNDQEATSDWELFVEGVSVATGTGLANLEHFTYTDPQALPNGNRTWRVEADGGRIVSPTLTFDLQYTPPAGPAITSATGTKTQGSVVTIGGSGFGTHANVGAVEWTGDWIEAATAGADELIDKAEWDQAGLPTTSGPSLISTTEAYSGTKSVFAETGDASSHGKDNIIMSHEPGFNFSSVYISYYVHFNPTVTPGNADIQWKMLRVNGAVQPPYGVNQDQTGDFYMYGDVAANGLGWDDHGSILHCRQGCPEPPTNWSSLCWNGNSQEGAAGTRNPTFSTWTKYELYIVASTPDTYDGSVWWTKHQVGSARDPIYDVADIATWTDVATCRTPNANYWSRFMFQNAYITRGAGGSEEAEIYFDDIYVQFDTQARVMLGDTNDITTCTKLEPQPLTSWTDGSVATTFNLGGHSGGGTLYYFVIHDDGTVSPAYSITVP